MALRRIVLLGPPGCGKGTYAKHLAPILGSQHVSTGDLIRAEIARGTHLGARFQACSSEGRLVPDNLIFELLEHVLQLLSGERQQRQWCCGLK